MAADIDDVDLKHHGDTELAAGLVDLAVTDLRPPLHLPVLAGLAQGPGFPNLSCLGLLSDRVLRRYVALAQRGPRLNKPRLNKGRQFV